MKSIDNFGKYNDRCAHKQDVSYASSSISFCILSARITGYSQTELDFTTKAIIFFIELSCEHDEYEYFVIFSGALKTPTDIHKKKKIHIDLNPADSVWLTHIENNRSKWYLFQVEKWIKLYDNTLVRWYQAKSIQIN